MQAIFNAWFTVVLLFGCLTRSDAAPAEPAKEIRILALGDSYTIGESVDVSGRWPEQLAARLRTNSLAVASPQIIARTGWTTANLASVMSRTEFTPPYDLVTVLIGVNDQFQGFGLESYEAGFKDLLAEAIRLTGGNPQHVIVVSIPDYSATPFAQSLDRAFIRKRIDEFNSVNRKLTRDAHARYVDVTVNSRKAGIDASYVAKDGLHPSAKMYAVWVELIYPDALAILKTPSASKSRVK